MVLCVHDFTIKVYNDSAPGPESELFIEEILAFLTYTDGLQVSFVSKLSSGSEETQTSTLEFPDKTSFASFVERFGKAKVVCESSLTHIRRLARPDREAWLCGFTPDEDKNLKTIRARAYVVKVLVQMVSGADKKRYLILIPKDGGELVITSDPKRAEHVVPFKLINNLGNAVRSLSFNYKDKGCIVGLSLTLPSLKDVLLVKSLIHSQQHHAMLLVPSEKSVRTQSLTVYALTFNMNRSGFQDSLDRLFSKSKDSQLACICLQEVPLLKRASVLKSVVFFFKLQGLELIAQAAMWEMALLIFLCRPMLGLVSAIEKRELTAGFLNLVGNKGGLLIAFDLMDTRLAVVGVHLRHGQKSFRKRNSTVWELFRSLHWGNGIAEVHLHADHCVFLGDTNYRIDHSFDAVSAEISKSNYQFLAKLDQLNTEKSQGRILCGFQVRSPADLP